MRIRASQCTAMLAAAAVAGAAAGVSTAIANKRSDQRGPIAGIAVQRVVVRDATGAAIRVVATATLPPASGAAARAGRASAAAGYAAATLATARRGGRLAIAATHGTSDVAPATAYRGVGPLRIGRLILPAVVIVSWSITGSHGGTFTIRGAADRGRGLAVSSRASHGSTRVRAGAYRNVVVSAPGEWTVVLAPPN